MPDTLKPWNPGCCTCGSSDTVPPIGISIPGCLCQNSPSSLSLTVTYGQGEDAHTYSNAYQSCGLSYYETAPGYMPSSAFSGPGYYSTSSWVDDQGFTDYFRLTCYSTQYALSLGQNNQGMWLAPGQIYNWNMGGRPPVNTCEPFSLAVGRTQPGIYFNGRFVISG